MSKHTTKLPYSKWRNSNNSYHLTRKHIGLCPTPCTFTKWINSVSSTSSVNICWQWPEQNLPKGYLAINQTWRSLGICSSHKWILCNLTFGTDSFSDNNKLNTLTKCFCIHLRQSSHHWQVAEIFFFFVFLKRLSFIKIDFASVIQL